MMSRTAGWLAGLTILVVGLAVSVTEVVGQRERPPLPPQAPRIADAPAPKDAPLPAPPVEMARPMIGPITPGRYQVAKATDDFIIVLDTATGELYRTPISEVKSFKDRPRIPEFVRPLPPEAIRRPDGERPPRKDSKRPQREGFEELKPLEPAPRPIPDRKAEREERE